jgi:hypothetical protein
MTSKLPSLALGLTILLLPATLPAQNLNIDWYKVAGGGGSSANGQFSVNGTVGQPDAGAMSGGQFSLTGGFWGIVAAVSTPGAPRLTITRTGANTVVVSWPSPSTGFVLQQSSTLPSGLWNNVPQSPTDNGTTKSIVISQPTGNAFFRLMH